MTEQHGRYCEGIKQAALTEFKETEDRARKLEGLSEKEIDKIVADVHIRHEKDRRRIDRHIVEESNR